MQKKQQGQQRTRRWLPLLALATLILIGAGCTLPSEDGTQLGAISIISRPSPIIAVAPLTGGPGTPISVSGSGWQSNDQIQIRLESVDENPQLEEHFITVGVREDGAFSTSFLFPTDALWQELQTVYVVAVSTTSEQRAAVPFQITTAIASVAPTASATQAALATARPTPTVATPAPASPGTARVTSAGLNIRSGPSANYTILRAVGQGTLLNVLGQNANGRWLLVRSNGGIEGWVARIYTDYRGGAVVVATLPPLLPTPTLAPSQTPKSTPASSFSEWRAEYYTNRTLSGSPSLVRNESTVGGNWGDGSPASGIPSDNFSARWVRTVDLDSDDYRFHVRVDDGVRLYVDNSLIIDQWQDGSSRNYSADRYLGSGSHTIRIEYYEHAGTAEVSLWWERTSSSTDNDDDEFPDWKGEYYTNRDLDGDPRFRRNDDEIDFNWGGDSPSSRLDDDNFSVRWRQRIRFDDDRYRFHFRVDDGVRFYIDGRRVLNEWHDNLADNVYTVERDMDGRHDLKIEYYEHRGGALIEFWWERVRVATSTPTPTSASTQTPTLSPTQIGRNTPTLTTTATLGVQPSANLRPTSGGLNTTLTVNGGGFPANAVVNVHLGTLFGVRSSAAEQAIYASTTTDRTGSYAVTFDMPETWADTTVIASGKILILVATEDFSGQASATFDYVAEPATATPTGTQPPTKMPLPTNTPVPPSVATATPIPQPYVKIQPAAGGAGTLVQVRGGGFYANMQVSVYLGLFDGAFAPTDSVVTYASTITDVNGDYEMSFVMPDAAPDTTPIPSGDVVVLVATKDFELTASTLFGFSIPETETETEIEDGAGGTIPAPSSD